MPHLERKEKLCVVCALCNVHVSGKGGSHTYNALISFPRVCRMRFNNNNDLVFGVSFFLWAWRICEVWFEFEQKTNEKRAKLMERLTFAQISFSHVCLVFDWKHKIAIYVSRQGADFVWFRFKRHPVLKLKSDSVTKPFHSQNHSISLLRSGTYLMNVWKLPASITRTFL